MRILPFIFTICIFILFYFKRFFVLRLYPPIMNFLIFMVFFSSLFGKETIIQKFAKMGKSNLEPAELTYTRNLTYVWCVFLFLNFIVSVITIFLSDKIWMIYNCFLSYFLVGTLFIIEYIIRIIYLKRHNL